MKTARPDVQKFPTLQGMSRIQSIDVFRGFTIFMMVFVNDLAGVSGIPQWMKHMPADADAMTFVDVVFPAFLFIVGMSIPLAIRAREAHGDSIRAILLHVAIRTAGLVLLGVFMVNGEEMNREANLLAPRLWEFLLYVAIILIWNRYPKAENNRKYLWWGLRIAGFVILFVLWQTFRKGETGALTGMTHSWWGILGLIGWAYLLAVLAYLLFRENPTAIAAVLALFIIMTLGLRSENIHLPAFLGWLKGQIGHLVHASLTIAGMLLAILFTDKTPADTPRKRIIWMVAVGIFALLAGYFLRPLHGISKIHATPSWALFSITICCFIFPLIYWLVDVKGVSKWATFLEPAGKNPLLTYILPALFFSIVGYSWMPEVLSSGGPGIVKSVVFALFILWLAALLTRLRIRLQL